MVGEVKSDEIVTSISENVEEVLRKEVTSFGTGAKVGCPKEHIGKTVYLVVCKD